MGKSSLEKLARDIAKHRIRVIDLTQLLKPSTPVIQLPPNFAPSAPFSISEISRYDDRGPAWYWNNIACGEHTGTHFDAPIHWISGRHLTDGATHTIDPQRFIAPACSISWHRPHRSSAGAAGSSAWNRGCCVSRSPTARLRPATARRTCPSAIRSEA